MAEEIMFESKIITEWIENRDISYHCPVFLKYNN